MYNKGFAKPSVPAAWGSVAVRPCAAGGYAPRGRTCTGAWPALGLPPLLKHWQGAGQEPGWLGTERTQRTLLKKLVVHSDWLQAVEKYSMTFLVSMCHQTSSILLELLGNNFAVLRYYIAWRKNYVYVFNKCYVTVFIWRNLTM